MHLLHIWINTLASVTVTKKILESRSLAQLCMLPSLQIVMHNIIFARLVHVCELLSALISSNFWTTFFLPTAFIKDQSVPHRFVSATPNKEKTIFQRLVMRRTIQLPQQHANTWTSAALRDNGKGNEHRNCNFTSLKSILTIVIYKNIILLKVSHEEHKNDPCLTDAVTLKE